MMAGRVETRIRVRLAAGAAVRESVTLPATRAARRSSRSRAVRAVAEPARSARPEPVSAPAKPTTSGEQGSAPGDPKPPARTLKIPKFSTADPTGREGPEPDR